ncbi:MAG: pseudouridine synthase, partial [Acidobacteriota bacterium]
MTAPAAPPPRLLLHEDEHLLVVCKPAGWNTHAPAPFAGEGLYEWLRHRKPRWASLSILHRLDKETSGVIVFGKTPLANRSLTEQFTRRLVRKKYRLVTDRPVARQNFTVASDIARAGERYASRAGGEPAETIFRVINTTGQLTEVEAEPRTGRTHQIRVHAAESGFPILGDTLYGGAAAARLHLHSCELSFAHPATGEAVTFRADPDFQAHPRVALRSALIDPTTTNAFRLIHGAADDRPGCYVDCLGPAVLWQGETVPDESACREVLKLAEGKASDQRPSSPQPSPPSGGGEGVATPTPQPSLYFKVLNRHVRRTSAQETSPRLLSGPAVPERFEILENGIRFELSFAEGYSVGLFLDQRDNRRRFLVNHVAAEFPLFEDGAAGREVLNTFAYTCGFSVCAAKA